MELKMCKKCNSELPANTEYFYRYSRNKDGLNNKCKKCILEYQKNNLAEYIAGYSKKYKKERYHNDKEYKEKILEKAKRYREKTKKKKKKVVKKFALIIK
jgi:hypothetical protein